ncbi:exodeoxyribonuclease III [Patescibacteria group bacterium]
MKIVSWNVNGLRSVVRKGFGEWLEKSDIDIVCLQETKIQEDQIGWDLKHIGNYSFFSSHASKKGYSGVAIYTKVKPISESGEFKHARFVDEGRFLELVFKDFRLINLYIPHGGRAKENLKYKLEVYEKLIDYLKGLKDEKIVLLGDFNIARSKIDLERPKSNKNNIMFTPNERKQLDKLYELGFVDAFRKLHKSGGNYTWWSYSHDARKRNLGWRIDYTFLSKSLIPKLNDSFILRDVEGSDHCPTGIELNILYK